MKHSFKSIGVLVFVVSLFWACGPSKSAMSSTGKISKYIEEFFVGDGVMQYFIQPLTYEGENQKNITLDATLRNKDKTKDSLTVNFLIHLKSKDTIQHVALNNSLNTYDIEKVKTFYFEPFEEDTYQHRVSIKLPYTIYNTYLLNSKHSITANSNSEKVTIKPTKKTLKAITVLNSKLDKKLR